MKLSDGLRTVFLAGVGAVAVTGEKAKKLVDDLMAGRDPEQAAEEKGLKQVSDTGAILAMVNEVLDANPQAIEDFKNGKKMVCKNVKSIKGNNAISWTKSGLKKGTAYKAYVKAYVMENGQKKYISTMAIQNCGRQLSVLAMSVITVSTQVLRFTAETMPNSSPQLQAGSPPEMSVSTLTGQPSTPQSA